LTNLKTKSAIFLLIVSLTALGNAAEPLKLFVVTGGHDYHSSFYRVFDDAGFKVNLRPHPGPFDGDLRKRVDVLVLYDMAPVKESANKVRRTSAIFWNRARAW
jgi:hypothetical protein